MRHFRTFLLALLPAFVSIMACNGQAGYTFKGNIAGAANMQVLLEQAHFDRSSTSLSRVAADANGNFNIKLDKPFEQALYCLTVESRRLYFILDGKEKAIEITGNLNTLDRMDVTVKGSPTLTCHADLIKSAVASPITSPEQAKALIQKSCTPLMKALLTSQLLGNNAGPYIADFKTAAKELSASMPGSKYATDYSNMIAQVEMQMTQTQAGESGGPVQIGQPAPEISLPDPKGKVRSLSSLKGKVVLLDFWASWCGPCRRENPHVVEVYNKYKAKGFEVFSVSLDGVDPRSSRGMSAEQLTANKESGKQRWQDAIQKDGLLWDNHVSDLQHWGSAPAATYGVSSIPKTFLIGRDGKIVAINPRSNLEEALLKAL